MKQKEKRSHPPKTLRDLRRFFREFNTQIETWDKSFNVSSYGNSYKFSISIFEKIYQYVNISVFYQSRNTRFTIELLASTAAQVIKKLQKHNLLSKILYGI